MPAYNAASTLERTYAEVPKDIVDEVILVDDCSRDNTIEQAQRLGLRCFRHERNWGYGRNQKTCYVEALKTGADVVIMHSLRVDAAKLDDLVNLVGELVIAQARLTQIGRASCRERV